MVVSVFMFASSECDYAFKITYIITRMLVLDQRQKQTFDYVFNYISVISNSRYHQRPSSPSSPGCRSLLPGCRSLLPRVSLPPPPGVSPSSPDVAPSSPGCPCTVSVRERICTCYGGPQPTVSHVLLCQYRGILRTVK